MRVYSMYYVCTACVTVYPGLQGEEQRIEQSPPDRRADAGSCHPAIFINTVHHRVQRAAIPRAQIIIRAAHVPIGLQGDAQRIELLRQTDRQMLAVVIPLFPSPTYIIGTAWARRIKIRRIAGSKYH